MKIFNKVFSELKVFSNISNAGSDNSTIQTWELPKNSTPICTDINAQAIYFRRNKLLNSKLDLTIAPAQSLPPQPESIKQQQQQQQQLQQQLQQQHQQQLQQQRQQQQNNQVPEPPVSKLNRQSETRKSGNFLLPKLPSFRLRQQNQPSSAINMDKPDVPSAGFKTSTLKPISNNLLQNDGVKDKIEQAIKKSSANLLIAENKQANVLEISRFSAIENAVTSSNMVRVTKADIPKSIKNEIKKDKSKCVIQ